MQALMMMIVAHNSFPSEGGGLEGGGGRGGKSKKAGSTGTPTPGANAPGPTWSGVSDKVTSCYNNRISRPGCYAGLGTGSLHCL